MATVKKQVVTKSNTDLAAKALDKASVLGKNYQKGGAKEQAQVDSTINAMKARQAAGKPMKTGGKIPTTPKAKKFAALAAPKNKITFADKLAGAKKKK